MKNFFIAFFSLIIGVIASSIVANILIKNDKRDQVAAFSKEKIDITQKDSLEKNLLQEKIDSFEAETLFLKVDLLLNSAKNLAGLIALKDTLSTKSDRVQFLVKYYHPDLRKKLYKLSNAFAACDLKKVNSKQSFQEFEEKMGKLIYIDHSNFLGEYYAKLVKYGDK